MPAVSGGKSTLVALAPSAKAPQQAPPHANPQSASQNDNIPSSRTLPSVPPPKTTPAPGRSPVLASSTSRGGRAPTMQKVVQPAPATGASRAQGSSSAGRPSAPPSIPHRVPGSAGGRSTASPPGRISSSAPPRLTDTQTPAATVNTESGKSSFPSARPTPTVSVPPDRQQHTSFPLPTTTRPPVLPSSQSVSRSAHSASSSFPAFSSIPSLITVPPHGFDTRTPVPTSRATAKSNVSIPSKGSPTHIPAPPGNTTSGGPISSSMLGGRPFGSLPHTQSEVSQKFGSTAKASTTGTPASRGGAQTTRASTVSSADSHGNGQGPPLQSFGPTSTAARGGNSTPILTSSARTGPTTTTARPGDDPGHKKSHASSAHSTTGNVTSTHAQSRSTASSLHTSSAVSAVSPSGGQPQSTHSSSRATEHSTTSGQPIITSLTHEQESTHTAQPRTHSSEATQSGIIKKIISGLLPADKTSASSPRPHTSSVAGAFTSGGQPEPTHSSSTALQSTPSTEHSTASASPKFTSQTHEQQPTHTVQPTTHNAEPPVVSIVSKVLSGLPPADKTSAPSQQHTTQSSRPPVKVSTSSPVTHVGSFERTFTSFFFVDWSCGFFSFILAAKWSLLILLRGLLRRRMSSRRGTQRSLQHSIRRQRSLQGRVRQ